jgi:hypothetical protein
MAHGRASKAPKKTAGEAMVIATAASVTTEKAGSVEISLPAGAGFPVGGIVVNSSDAGSVKSTGAPNVPATGLGADRPATGGCAVTTVAAGSVNFSGHVRDVDTTGAGSVKIGFIAAELAVPATGAGGDHTHGHGPGGDVAGTSTAGATIAGKVAAAALYLLDLASGDSLHALLVLIAGAAEMHARGAIGRRILYASLAALLVGIAAYQFGWRFSNSSPFGRPGLHPC